MWRTAAVEVQYMTEIEKIVNRQRKYFAAGKTKSYAFRIRALTELENSIRFHEK